MITIQTQKDAIRETQKKLKYLQKKSPSAIANAINRAATTVRKNISVEVRKEYSIKAGDVKKSLGKVPRATRKKLFTEVRSEGETIPLRMFKVSPRTINNKRKKPIKVGVKKGSLKTVIGAFVKASRGDGIYVARRYGKSRIPTGELFGPSIPQLIGNEEVREKINNSGQDMLYKRLDHEINRVLEKGRG